MSRDATPAGVVVDPATCAEAHLGHASRERSGSGRSTSRVAPRCAFVSVRCVWALAASQTRESRVSTLRVRVGALHVDTLIFLGCSYSNRRAKTTRFLGCVCVAGARATHAVLWECRVDPTQSVRPVPAHTARRRRRRIRLYISRDWTPQPCLMHGNITRTRTSTPRRKPQRVPWPLIWQQHVCQQKGGWSRHAPQPRLPAPRSRAPQRLARPARLGRRAPGQEIQAPRGVHAAAARAQRALHHRHRYAAFYPNRS